MKGKETNPRKGTETRSLVLTSLSLYSAVKETNPRKGTETEKPLGAFFVCKLALWGFHPHTFKRCHI